MSDDPIDGDLYDDLEMYDASSWDAIWIHARLATMVDGDWEADPGGGWVSSNGHRVTQRRFGAIGAGAIAVQAGRIAWVGPMAELPGRPERLARAVFDAENCWITPGLIDCHTHLVYEGNEAAVFAQWLEEQAAGRPRAPLERLTEGNYATVIATRAANEEELYASAARRLSLLMNEGVTTVEAKSGFGLDLATELKQLRVMRRLANEFPVSLFSSFRFPYIVPPEFEDRRDDFIDFMLSEMLPQALTAGLVDGIDAYAAGSFPVSESQLDRILSAAQERGLPISLHSDRFAAGSGAMTAARWRARAISHLNHIDEAGVEALAAAGVVAELLPANDYYLQQTKVPPIQLLRDHGVAMAVATDTNPHSSPVSSLLTVMNMACVIYGLTAEEAVAGVTRNAARALGREQEIGTLEVGKKADFILWEIDDMYELVYALGFNPRHATVRNGVVTFGTL